MRFGYFIALWTQLYSHWLILFGSFREAFCFLAYVTALRLPRFISNAFENDFAAIHHHVNLTNSLTKSCQCTRRLKTGFLLFFICLFQSKSRLLHITRTTKPHKKKARGGWRREAALRPGAAPGPGRGRSAWARPGGEGPARGGIARVRPGGESPEPGRLGPASRWLCAATCRARWHRHGQAGQAASKRPRSGLFAKTAGAELPAAAAAASLLLSGPAHKEALEQIKTGVACAKHCNACLIISSDGKRARK